LKSWGSKGRQQLTKAQKSALKKVTPFGGGKDGDCDEPVGHRVREDREKKALGYKKGLSSPFGGKGVHLIGKEEGK